MGNGELLGMVSNVFLLREGSPIFMQRYEKKYGRDENKAVPRCLMAAKFISSGDMTGEKTLQHWIAMGQIQVTTSYWGKVVHLCFLNAHG